MTGPIFPRELEKINSLACSIHLENHSFNRLEFDSRSITNPEDTLFICLKGQNKDGHHYIHDLIKKGVSNFLVSDDSFVSEKANFYLISNTVVGFQEVASLIRNKFKNDVVAITGSNGKTIVKEWLAQLLSIKFSVAKSPKSYNSQIGVPYSVSRLNNEDIGIIECGISLPDEMQKLKNCVKPNLGIFTNIGDAHSSGFPSRESKIEEKCKLFAECKKVICTENIKPTLSAYLNKNQLISWGANGDYNVETTINSENSKITINNDIFLTALRDKASLENIIHCIIFSLEQGLKSEEIQYGLNLLKSVPMRLEIKQGFNQNLILNDSYNNDITGLRHAIDQAKRLDQTKKRTLIISEIVQHNSDKNDLDNELKEVLKSITTEEIILVGNQLKDLANKLKNTLFFRDSKEVSLYLAQNKRNNHFYILKGARQFHFEDIVDVLEQKQHLTRIEVNLSTLISNLSHYRKLLKPETKIMVMVKAFAYGTSIVEVAKLLEIQKVDYLAVAYTDEGIILRESGIKTPIMVMNPALEDLHNLEQFNLEPEVYSLQQLHHFNTNKTLKLHFKLDTGMHRLGFDKNSFPDLLNFLKENQQTNIVSCLTHLAGADEMIHDNYTTKQLSSFKKMTGEISAISKKSFLKHALNSAGIERHTDSQMDMVRLGIGLYGFGNNKNITPCLTLKTTISQIRDLEKGETVGYGRKGKINKATKVATLPIGYADGYDRRFSQGVGSVIINDQEAFVIGNVCMDMTMVDVTHINCAAGDEVIIYDKTHNITKLASRINTISYELLTHLSERVRRIFFFD